MNIIELVLFRAREGVGAAQIIAASDRIAPILSAMPGFISRELAVAEDGRWADVVHWTSIEFATSAAKAVMENETCLAYFGLIDQSSMDFLHLNIQSKA